MFVIHFSFSGWRAIDSIVLKLLYLEPYAAPLLLPLSAIAAPNLNLNPY